MKRLLSDLTAAEVEEARILAEQLTRDGYQIIRGFFDLSRGARVRANGHQFRRAFIEGTGTVVHVLERKNSAFTRQYEVSDIELIVSWDHDESFPQTGVSQVAQYHLVTVEKAPR